MTKKKNDLPVPAGFRILLKPRELQEKTAGGIILVDETKHHQKLATNISQVVAMGPDCYEDKSQKWCSVGDWVRPTFNAIYYLLVCCNFTTYYLIMQGLILF